MRKSMLGFCVIVFISISIQSVLAQDTCRIIVNNYQGAGAYVEISQSGQIVSSGNADNNGVFYAYPINIGARYTVVVRYAGRNSITEIPALWDPTYVGV
jgi:hypothetical protein